MSVALYIVMCDDIFLYEQNAEFFCNRFVSFYFCEKLEEIYTLPVYRDYGIIFCAISSFPKRWVGYLKLSSSFREKSGLRKRELFGSVKVTYYIWCLLVDETTIY
jgi:hypothetical protein